MKQTRANTVIRVLTAGGLWCLWTVSCLHAAGRSFRLCGQDSGLNPSLRPSERTVQTSFRSAVCSLCLCCSDVLCLEKRTHQNGRTVRESQCHDVHSLSHSSERNGLCMRVEGGHHSFNCRGGFKISSAETQCV